MTCGQARRLLAAYRRDDWSPAQLDALGRHLAGCADCRRTEADFRQAGERVRQLPSIQPSPSLRQGVYAAIRAEQARRGRPAAELARFASEDTQPGLRAIRPPRRRSAGGALVRGAAVAAVVLLALAGARLMPAAGGIAGLAASLTGAPSAPHVAQYTAVPTVAGVTGALASSRWLVYAAHDVRGRPALYAEDRASHRTSALLPRPLDASSGLALRALTDHWALWLSGADVAGASWTLWATPLPATPGGPAGPSLALTGTGAGGADPPTWLGGAWAQADEVLLALATRDDALVERFDLTPGRDVPAPTVVAHASAAGHLLTNPSASAGTYYWAEVWIDGATGLHSDIWRQAAGGRAQPFTSGGDAFAPHAADGALIWVRPGGLVRLDADPVTDGAAAAAQATLPRVAGTVQARDLGGRQHELGRDGIADTVQAAGALVLWGDGAAIHTYDLRRGAPTSVDGQVRQATFAALDGAAPGGDALAWGHSGSTVIDVYDVH
jgi:hypothetical protein